MIGKEFRKTIERYLTEADAPPPPDAGAPADGAPPPDAGGMPPPDAGGMPNPGMDGGGMPDMGGGMPGADGSAPGGGNTAADDICSERYVRLVAYLCELYNTNVSSKPKLVLNLKVKVGEITNLNEEDNAKNVFMFMIDNFLNDDIKEDVENLVKKTRETLKDLEKDGKLAGKTAHNANSQFLIDVTIAAYTAVCSNALGEDVPEINYGINKEYRVDPQNAKAVFDEIKKNVDEIQKLSEVDG